MRAPPLGTRTPREAWDPHATRPCLGCLEPISAGALLCPHCATAQSTPRFSGVGSALKWSAAVVTVISLVMGTLTLGGLYSDWRTRRETAAELVAAARLLDDAGRHDQAWAMHEQALALVPSSSDARDAQVETAMSWLRNARIGEDDTFAELVGPILPVLYRGLATRPDDQAGDLLAHIGWAYFLQARDREAAGQRDAYEDPRIDALFARAAEADADNVYAHAMWGFRLAAAGGSFEAAADRFDTAITAAAAAGDSGRLDYARRLRINAYRFVLARPSGVTDDRRRRAGDELLRVVDRLRAAGEPLPDDDVRYRLFNHYGRRGDASEAEAMLGVLPAADHLATFEWLFADMYPSPEDPAHHDPNADQRRYLLARLAENAGDGERALAIYHELAAERHAREGLAALVDAGIERITGRRTERAEARAGRRYIDDEMAANDDPWAFHEETLMNFDPRYVPPNATDALAFFTELPADRVASRAGEALVLLERARERLRGFLEEHDGEVARYGYTSGYSASHAEHAAGWHHELWALVGRYSLETGDVDRAIAELGDLAARLDPVPDRIHFDLARAHARRAATRSTGAAGAASADAPQASVDTPQADRARADRRAALDHLEAATAAALAHGGTVSWVRIREEPDFAPLRDDPRYDELVRGR